MKSVIMLACRDKLTILLCLGFIWSIAQAKPFSPVLKFEHWETTKGAQVYFVATDGRLPLLTINVAFPAGSVADSQALQGLAKITNTLLACGAGDLSAEAVINRFENVGAQYSNGISRDMALVSLRTLSQPSLQSVAVDTFVKVLTQPKFLLKELQLKRQQQLADILQISQSPADIGLDKFYEMVFHSHPYANPILGTESSVQRIQLPDVRRFYQQYYLANRAMITLVGPLSLSGAKALAEKITQGLPIGPKQQSSVLFHPSIKLSSATKKEIQFPSGQTTIYLGHLGVNRDNPAYFPLLVGNHILGGGILTSRLSHEIRELRGLTYGVSSEFVALQQPGPFIVSLATRHTQKTQALALARGVIERFIHEGPTESELNDAKRYLTGSFLLNLADNQQISNALLGLGFYHLPSTYFDDYEGNISAVTKEQIKAAFQQYVHPDKMIEITVGPSSG